MSNWKTLVNPRSQSSVSLLATPVEEPLASLPGSEMKEELTGLYQSIDGVAMSAGKRIIQFVGTKQNEGTSTIVSEFAKLVANKFNKIVLLLDADLDHPTQHKLFSFEPQKSWLESLSDERLFEQTLYTIGSSGLYLGALMSNPVSTPPALNSGMINRLFARLRQRFDLILIDSAPLITSPESLAISGKTDGVVVVVEADKTRMPVAARTKERIIKQGGEILGVVLNKRRFHIPPYVYDRL